MTKLMGLLLCILASTGPVLADGQQQDSRYPQITYNRIDQFHVVMELTHPDFHVKKGSFEMV